VALLSAKEVEPEKSIPSAPDNRGGLLAQIQQGKKLKAAAIAPEAGGSKPSGTGREGLLQEIKKRNLQGLKAKASSPLDAEAIAKKQAENERSKAMALKASFDTLERTKKKYSDLLTEAEGLKKIVTAGSDNIPNSYQAQLATQVELIANLTRAENRVKELVQKRKEKEQALKKQEETRLQEEARLQALANPEVSAAPFDAPPMDGIPMAPSMDEAPPREAPPIGDIPMAPSMDGAPPPEAPPMGDIPMAPPMDGAPPLEAPPMGDIPMAPPMDDAPPPEAPRMDDFSFATSSQRNAGVGKRSAASEAPVPATSTPAAGLDKDAIKIKGELAAERSKEKFELDQISEVLLNPEHDLHKKLMEQDSMKGLEAIIKNAKVAAVKQYQASLDPVKDKLIISSMKLRSSQKDNEDDLIEEIWEKLSKQKKYKDAILETVRGVVKQDKGNLSSLYNDWSKEEEAKKIKEANANAIAQKKREAETEKKLADERNKALSDANIILNPDEKRVNDFVEGSRITAALAKSEGDIFLAEIEKKIKAAGDIIATIPEVDVTPNSAPTVPPSAETPTIEPHAETPAAGSPPTIAPATLTSGGVAEEAQVTATTMAPLIAPTKEALTAEIPITPATTAIPKVDVAPDPAPTVAPSAKIPTVESPPTIGAVAPLPKESPRVEEVNASPLTSNPVQPIIQPVNQLHNGQKAPQTTIKLGWTKELENQLQLEPLFKEINKYIKNKSTAWNFVMLRGVDKEKKINNAIKLKAELADIMLKTAKEHTDPITGELQATAIESIKDKMIVRLKKEVKKDHDIIESSVWGRKGEYSNFLIQTLDKLEPNNKYSSSPDNPWNKGVQVNTRPRH
jgi:hypothetical protein